MIGKQTAISYANENYSEIGLTYKNIEFSTVYDDYIVSFSDESGTTYNFRLSSKYFPTSVAYDSVKQSQCRLVPGYWYLACLVTPYW